MYPTALIAATFGLFYASAFAASVSSHAVGSHAMGPHNIGSSAVSQHAVTLAKPTFSAQEGVPLLGKLNRYGNFATESINGISRSAKDYQLGDEWGKKEITPQSLEQESAEFQRAAKATAKAGGATSFYLGKFDGKHVMATNYHVFSRSALCKRSSITFPLLNKRFTCGDFLGAWSDIDLALFEIQVNDTDTAEKLQEVAANFDFAAVPYQGQELLTIGFGTAENSSQKLVGNKDSDCKVFSKDGEFRFLADPDEVNPADYKAWSFSNGCDVSHGDSGSAIVDRNSGRPIGIIWTGRIPKATSVQSGAFLDKLIAGNGPEVWTELSFAVPAVKIKQRLEEYLKSNEPDASTRRILESLLNN